VDDVRQALVRQNLKVPGGRVDQGPRELVLRTLVRLRTEREFNDLIVANRNGYPIRVRDVGHASDSNEEPRTLARLDGDGAVSLVVQKQSGVNTVKVVEDVKDRLGQLKAALPPDIATEIIGGQMLSLLLALLVTPVFYALLDQVVNLAHRLGIRFTVEPRPRPHPAIEAKRRPKGYNELRVPVPEGLRFAEPPCYPHQIKGVRWSACHADSCQAERRHR